MRFIDQGMLGFAEVNPGRVGIHLWNSQATFDAHFDAHEDLAIFGGTPPEEYEWEEGTEAPLRPTLRTPPAPADRDPSTLPSTELMLAWANAATTTATRSVLDEARQAELLQAERERMAAELVDAELAHRKRVAKIKRQLAARRDVGYPGPSATRAHN